MSTSIKSKASRQDRNRKILSGAQKHFPPGTSFILAGNAYGLPELIELGKVDTASADEATLARAAWLRAVQLQRDTFKKTDQVFASFRSYVISRFGGTLNAADILSDFGFTARRPRTTPVAVKATAADKMRATRKARGTLSAKQKKAIHGTVHVAASPPPSTASPRPDGSRSGAA